MYKVDDDVFQVGWLPEAAKANTYFVRHVGKAGNWMINCPKIDEQLVQALDSVGGVHHIFATHRDVVMHVNELARRYGAKRIIHEGDLDALPDAEIVIKGKARQILAGDENWIAIPTAGVTEGHCMLHYVGKYLFAGDALKVAAESLQIPQLAEAPHDHQFLVESVERLADSKFRRILPGHGDTLAFPTEEVLARITACVNEAKTLGA